MINYKHLHYFWVAAKQGGVARASERLHLTPQTISGQISLLEEQLGEALFKKAGRNLELTETGRLVLSYADEIFSLGGELEDAVRNLPSTRPMVFKVGVADVVPKTIAYRLLAPALSLADPVRIVCRESSLDSLLGELALHQLDLVIADNPIPSGLNVRGFSHSLGESGVSFLAAPVLAASLAGEFPACLDGAPLLLPSAINSLQGRLLQWLEGLHIYPRVIGEFDDSALMKSFGQAGAGVFIAPTAIVEEVAQQYAVQVVGATGQVLEQFFAISAERKISNPAVAAITETARAWLR
jgi:LysR family transcriptional activator of nhaA